MKAVPPHPHPLAPCESLGSHECSCEGVKAVWEWVDGRWAREVAISHEELISRNPHQCFTPMRVKQQSIWCLEVYYVMHLQRAILPIPSASLVHLLLRPSRRLWGEWKSPRRGALFDLCFLPVCAAHPADPKSGRSNKGAAQESSGIPLARCPHQHDKTVVNKPQSRSEPPSYNSGRRPMMRRVCSMWLFPLFTYAGHYSPGCEHVHAHVHNGSGILRSEALVPNKSAMKIGHS